MVQKFDPVFDHQFLLISFDFQFLTFLFAFPVRSKPSFCGFRCQFIFQRFDHFESC